MSDTRREFLSKCLGGAAVVAAANLGSAVPAPVIANTYSPFDRVPDVRIRTDFNPSHTRLYWTADDSEVLFVQELMLQFNPNSKLQQFAARLIVQNDSIRCLGSNVLQDAARIRFRENPVPGRSHLYLTDKNNVKRNVNVLAYGEELSDLPWVYVTGFAEVVEGGFGLTEKFHQCTNCWHCERHIDFGEIAPGWQSITKNNAQMACPNCRLVQSRLERYLMSADLFRVHMSVSRSRAVFYPPESPKPVAWHDFAIDPTYTANFTTQYSSLPNTQLFPKSNSAHEVWLDRVVNGWNPPIGTR